MLDSRFWLFCKQHQRVSSVGITFLCAVSVLFFRVTIVGVTADGQTYLQIARNIRLGAGLGWQATWASPFQPVLVAIVSYFVRDGDLQIASLVVTSTMFLLLVLGVWLLVNEIFTPIIAGLSAVCVAVFPAYGLIIPSTEVELAYTALLSLSLWSYVRALKTSSVLFAVLSGVFFATTYLTRSEGFLVFGAVLVSSGVICFRRSRWTFAKLFACAVLAFFLVSLPYLVFLKQTYGAWVISPKSTYVFIWMQDTVYHDTAFGEILNPNLWGLTPDGKLKWQVPTGVGTIAKYLLSHPAKSWSVYIKDLSYEIPGRIPNGSGMEGYPQTFPVLFVLSALYALIQIFRAEKRVYGAVLAAPFVVLIILPVFTSGWWKYLLPYSFIVLSLGCVGLSMAIEKLLPKQKRAYGDTIVALVITLTTVAFYFSIYSASMAAAKFSPEAQDPTGRRVYAAEAYKAGCWVAKKYGAGHNYMVNWSKVIYPLNGLWTAFPVASFQDIYAYAKRQNAEFVLIEPPGDATDEMIKNAPPGMKFEDLYQSPTTPFRLAIFRVL